MTTTVADLQAALATLPSDMPVILAMDAEGNSYSPLSTTGDALYLAASAFTGEFYATAEMRAACPEDDWAEAPDTAVPALFLWPTN